MKYYSQYRTYELFDLQQSLSGLSKSNRWVMLGDNLPWDRIERAYNKHHHNAHSGAVNKPARIVVGALIVRHIESLSDEKTIESIQENPYMQYMLGLPAFTEQPVFTPKLFVTLRKRLDSEFFNMLTKMLVECDGSAPPRAETLGIRIQGCFRLNSWETRCEEKNFFPILENFVLIYLGYSGKKHIFAGELRKRANETTHYIVAVLGPLSHGSRRRCVRESILARKSDRCRGRRTCHRCEHLLPDVEPGQCDRPGRTL